MAKLEDQLAKLSQLQFENSTDTALNKANCQPLAKALKAASNHVVAKAAQLVGEHRLHELTDELVTAFNRLMTQPAKRDKGGNGLTELVKTLTLLGYQDADLFAKGSFHVQMEPVYGGKVDVADHMRGWCAQGLAQSSGAEGKGMRR